jgi:Yip1 domain
MQEAVRRVGSGELGGSAMNGGLERKREKGRPTQFFMDDSQQSGAAGQPVAETSLAARLMNVYVAPGEVFAEIKDRPVEAANWVAPMVLAVITGIIYVMVVFSQPAVMQGMKDAQDKAMQERVTAGKMTQQQADAATEAAGRFMTPTILKSLGILGVIFFSAGWLFFLALILWFVGWFGMRGQMSYLKMVEVVGLSTMISVLGGIVAMTLAVIYGSTLMTPSAILVAGHFDSHNLEHQVLASLNVMTLWYMAVLSVGLGQVTGKGFGRAALWIYGLWALVKVPLIWWAVRM